MWFAEHIDAFQTFVNALNLDVFLTIEDAQEVLKAPNLRDNLGFLAPLLGFLPPPMMQIEKPDMGSRSVGLFLFEKVENKVSETLGARGEALQQKLIALKNKKP